jgi:nucleoside-diphosphate-sugar epimerase
MHLLVFGLGTCGSAVARDALAAGIAVTATSRNPESPGLPGVSMVSFDAAEAAIADATHILSTAPPRHGADPVLSRYGPALQRAGISWIGYLSTTGVYGDRGGGWVDEATEPAPSSDRGRRRVEAEQGFRDVAAGRPLDLFRLAGIYGPGRSALDEVRAGHARRIIAPGHAFGRIHVDDIAAAVMAAIASPPSGTRVLNLSDDEPAPSAAVIEEAARLLGLPPPPAIPFVEAYAGMSEMGRSFWDESRRVSSAATQSALGITWRYPTYREGLAAILAEER